MRWTWTPRSQPLLLPPRIQRGGQPLFDSEIPAARGRARSERETFAKDLQRNAGRCSNGTRLHRYLKARSGAKTRPKARRREQGSEIKLCMPAPPAPPQHDGRRAQEGARRSSARQQTSRPLMTEHTSASRAGPDCEQNGLHHGQPDVKQGGAQIRRFSGDPVQSIASLFKAGGTEGGSPPHFLF